MDLELEYIRNPDGTRKLVIADDKRAAGTAFVRELASKPPTEIAAVVQEGHDHFIRALDGLSAEQAAHKPSADDWSVLELMAHVVTTKRVVAVLAKALGEGQLPPGFGPQIEHEAAQDGITTVRFDTVEEAREAAQAAHGDLLAFIASLDGEVNTELQFKHFVFGAFNSRQWAAFQRLHDDNHTPQMFDIKASPGFPGA